MTTRNDIIKEIINQEWTGSLNDFVPAINIKTDNEVNEYKERGYTQVVKVEELEKIIGPGVDVNRIYYDKNGMTPRTVYYDKEYDIIMNLTLGKDINGKPHILYQEKTLNDDIQKFVSGMKGLLKDKDYARFIISTPRAYRQQILASLNKKDSDVTYEKYQGAVQFD